MTSGSEPAGDPDSGSDGIADEGEHGTELEREDGYAVALVRRDGTEETIVAEPGEPILRAAERARVSLPFGCRYGACGTCTARVLEGEVAHLEPPRALKPDALEEGFVLACIAVAESDCRLRVGHDVQAEVLGTPWK